MDTKSTKNEVELPLLDKSLKKAPSDNKQHSLPPSKKETKAQAPKYFDVNLFSRIIFGWANNFIYVYFSSRYT